MLDEEIEGVLLFLREHPGAQLQVFLMDPSQPHFNSWVLDEMKRIELIREDNELSFYLTAKGYRLIESGGWIKHQELEKNKEKEDQKKRGYETDGAYWSSQLSKLQVKLFWPILIGSFIGGLFGTAALGMELYTKYWSKMAMENSKISSDPKKTPEQK